MSAFESHPPEEVSRAKRRARHLLLFVLVQNMLTFTIRILASGESQSILAIALDDAAEIVSAVGLLVAFHLQNRPKTHQRPLGYSGAGSIVASLTALTITFAGAYIIWISTNSLLHGPTPITGTTNVLGLEVWSGWWKAFVAIVTTLNSFWAYWYATSIAKVLQWDALETDATAHLVSIFNTGAAVTGITLGALGFAWGDPLAALIIGLLFLRDGYMDARRAASRLVEEPPSPGTMQQLDAVVASKPYVRDHRWMVWLEDNYINGVLFVATPDCRLSETNAWREELQRELREAEWRIDDLVIAFGTDIPPSIPPPQRARHEER